MNRLFLYLRTIEFRKNFLLAILSVIILIVSVFFALRSYTRHGESLPVPDLKGLKIEEAVALLRDRGLRYSIDSLHIADLPGGTITEQDPAPNTTVKAKRTIYLTVVKKHPPDISFPDIENKPLEEAKAILLNAGIKIGNMTYRSHVALNTVLGASLNGKFVHAGDVVPKGVSINLTLGDGKGDAEVDIPNLIGLTLNEARLAASGGSSSLSIGEVIYEGSIADTSKAVIIRQNPVASDTLVKIPIGSRINIVLSQ